MKLSHSPYVLYADGMGNVYEDTSLYACGRSGRFADPIPAEDWIPLPSGGNLLASANSSGYFNSASNTSTGIYTIDYTNANFSNAPTIQVTIAESANPRVVMVKNVTQTSCTVEIYNLNGSLRDEKFYITITGEH